MTNYSNKSATKDAFSTLDTSSELTSDLSSELDFEASSHFDSVFSRLIEAIGGKRASDLAEALGISQASVSGAKRRGNIPDSWYPIIAEKYDVSMDWLRTGLGEMKRGTKFKTAKLPNPDMISGQVPTERSLQPKTAEALVNCLRCKQLAVDLEKERGERTAVNSLMIQELRERLDLITEMGQLRMDNLKLTHLLETVQTMCKEQHKELITLKEEVTRLRKELGQP